MWDLKVEDVNNDGKYTADKDRKIIGYSDPAYRFSILNSFRYKNWEFKFLINSVQGGKNYFTDSRLTLNLLRKEAGTL